MSFNKVILMGRLTRDPEIKLLPSGKSVCNFSVATNRIWKNSAGQKQEDVVFHPVVVYGPQAEACSKYLNKGSEAFIEGRVNIREYEDKNGVKRQIYEIITSIVQFVGDSGKTNELTSGGIKTAASSNNINVDDIPF